MLLLPLLFVLTPPEAVSQHLDHSIYRLNWAADISVTAVAAATIITMYALEHQLGKPRCPCDQSEVPGIDRWSLGKKSEAWNLASDLVVYGAVAAPALLSAFGVGFNRTLLEDLMVLAETCLVTSMLATIVEFGIPRPRPNVYAGLAPELTEHPNGYRSYYSGHVAMSVAGMSALAMILHARYQQYVWPWFLAAGAGGAVMISRVLSGEHFLTDTALGFLMGAVTGVLIPMLHLRNGPFVSAAPVAGGGGMVTLVDRF